MNEPAKDVTVDVDGVSLRKTLNDHQFETLAVVFDIRSGRDSAAEVSVADVIPDGVATEDIGFHPEYGGEHWRAEETEVVFSRTFEPGEQYTTVYGVRDFEHDLDELLAEPTVEVDERSAGSVEDVEDLVSEEDSDVVREVIAGERDTLPGLEAEADEGVAATAEAGGVGGVSADDEEDVVAAEAAADGPEPMGDDEETAADEAEPEGADVDESGEDAMAEGAADADELDADEEASADGDDEEDTTTDEADAEAAATVEDDEDEAEEAPSVDAVEAVDEEAEADDEITVPVTGGIARVLAKELRAGNVSYDDRRLLREELLPADGSTDARIRRLQTQVADLASYTDALEAFLDEEGGAEVILGDLKDEIADLADDLSDVNGSVDGVDARVDELTEDVGEVEGSVDAVEGDLDEVAADVDDVTATTERLSRDVEDLRDDVDRIETLDRSLERVEGDIAEIREELEGLAEFRERLSSVFGAAGGEAAGGPAAGGDDEASDDGPPY